MPVTTSYPGVYIEELPSGVRTITGVPTSITAFLGRAARGPVNKPVRITSFAAYERTFGTLAQNSQSTMTYGVKSFFDNGGGEAFVVRLFRPLRDSLEAQEQGNLGAKLVGDAVAAATSTAEAVQKAKDAVDAIPASEPLKRAAADAVRAAVATRASQAVSKDEVLDAVAAEVDQRLAATSPPPDDLVKAVLPKLKAAAVNAKNEAADVAAMITLFGTKADVLAPTTATQAVKDAVRDIKAVADKDKILFPLVKAKGAEETTAQSRVVLATWNKNGLKLKAIGPGPWGQELRARVDLKTSTEAKDANRRLFNLTVTDGSTVEEFKNLSSLRDDERWVRSVLEASSELVRWSDTGDSDRPTETPAPPAGAAPLSPGDTPAKPDQAQLSDTLELEDPDYLGTRGGPKAGVLALDDVDLFNLLCTPPPRRDGPPLKKDTVQQLLVYCGNRRAFYIADTRPEWDETPGGLASFLSSPTNALDDLGLTGDAAKNGATFFPRLRQSDLSQRQRPATFATSGAMAGVFARTDATRGVWKAPAGIDASLVGVLELKAKLSDVDNGTLNPLAVNCLRSLPVIGTVSWGARTARGADRLSDLDNRYIPVRRLTLFLEESLYRGTQFAVFEPNDEPLWAQLRLTVGAFMNDLFRQGAFAGRSPREAYEVRCDATTTTQNDVNAGRVIVVVKFAPLKPAEFVILRIQQLAGQVQT